jgi:excisionase family DNA binding protein
MPGEAATRRAASAAVAADANARRHPESQRPQEARLVNAQHRPLTRADVMTAAEVAELIGAPTSTIYHWARTGTLPSTKLGRRRVFIRSLVEDVLLGTAGRESGR